MRLCESARSMTKNLARVLAFCVPFGIGVAVAATPAAIPDTLRTDAESLPDVVRAFVSRGTTPTAFNIYARYGVPLAPLAVRDAPFPKGYRTFRVRDPQIAWGYFLVMTPRDTGFVIYAADRYFGGWQPANQRLPGAEAIVAPALPGYKRRELRNGVLYSSTGKATVELLITEGAPSETHNANYAVRMLVFPRGVPVLTLDAPCEWWTMTPPPDSRRLTPRACEARWIEVPNT